MLSKNRRYIGLDFETTGLDTQKDEAIQIALVEIDTNGKIIKKYQSLCKPDKDINELKDIVAFMTGLSLKDLEKAPDIQILKPEIESFFDEKTILIWHNIDFDIKFLKKYFPNIKFSHSIDTYFRSQNFVHFAPSYALEILINHLNSNHKEDFEPIAKLVDIEQTDNKKFHEAEYDTKSSLGLFLYCIKRIHQLQKKYPQLEYYLHKEDSIFNKIITNNNSKTTNKASEITFPSLERILPNDRKFSYDKDDFNIQKLQNRKSFFIGNVPINTLLKKIANSKNTIFAFSNKQKLDIAKNFFQKEGIKNIWFVRPDQRINPNIFKSFLNKSQFKENEVFFLLKYLSHLEKWMWMLDLNNTNDNQIFYFLKEKKNSTKYPIVFTTHGWLYHLFKDIESEYFDYDVIFFDNENRYKSYHQYLSHPCDLYFTLQFLETLLYTYQTRNQIKIGKYNNILDKLETFTQRFQIFMWILFSESKKLFKNTDKNFIEFNPIIDNSSFHQSTQSRKNIMEAKDNLQKELLEVDRNQLDKQLLIFDQTFNTINIINRRVSNNSDIYFLFKESTKFTNRWEFKEIFDPRKVIFFSNFNQEYIDLDPKSKNEQTSYQLKNIHSSKKLIERLKSIFENEEQQSQNIFILSSKKHQSREIFEACYQENLHKKTKLMAENITWWIGKNIFKIKQWKPNIIIWSYNFLMWIFAKGIDIDIVVNFNIKWPQEKYLLNDLNRYANK